MNELSQLKSDAVSLAVGESETVYCPFCDNEKPYPPSMSLTRTETGILYNCYRASCSGRGHIGSLPSNMIETKVKPEFTPNSLTDPTGQLSNEIEAHLVSKYNLTVSEMHNHNFKELTLRSGIVMPLYTQSGSKWGNTVKLFNTKSKAKHYIDVDVPSRLAWCKLSSSVDEHTTVILTEDVLSAVRCSRFYRSCALLGTNLTSEMIKDLLSAGYVHVILALDPDALSKAVKLQQQSALFFSTFRIASLSADPKDLEHDKLEEELDL